MKARSTTRVLAFGLAVAISGAALAQSASEPTGHYGSEHPAVAAPELDAEMLSAWQGHIIAMRDYALAVHAGDAAKEEAASRAGSASADRIAGIFATFYGPDVGANIRKLMEAHCADVEALARAAQANDAAAGRAARNSLRADATSLARLLARANPDAFDRVLRDALMQDAADHVTLVDEVMGNTDAATQAQSWDDIREHARIIAEAFSDGIARQFPARVR